MPVRPDAPLRKVTLNLYEADCQKMALIHGQGWSTAIREMVHVHCNRQTDTAYNPRRPRTLGDLADE